MTGGPAALAGQLTGGFFVWEEAGADFGAAIAGRMTIYTGIALVIIGSLIAACLAGFIRVPFSLPLSEASGFGLIVAALAVVVVGCVLMVMGI